MHLAPQIKFHRCITFDSAQNSTVGIPFASEKHWKLIISHVRIQLADGNWEDPAGYLKFEIDGGSFKNFTILNGTYSSDGSVLPLIAPDLASSCRSPWPLRGSSLSGKTTLTPSVLDSQYQPVALSRLYLCMIIVEDDGTI